MTEFLASLGMGKSELLLVDKCIVSSQTYLYQVCMLRQGRIFLLVLNKNEQ